MVWTKFQVCLTSNEGKQANHRINLMPWVTCSAPYDKVGCSVPIPKRLGLKLEKMAKDGAIESLRDGSIKLGCDLVGARLIWMATIDLNSNLNPNDGYKNANCRKRFV